MVMVAVIIPSKFPSIKGTKIKTHTYNFHSCFVWLSYVVIYFEVKFVPVL
jgi:hypothetical protein